MTTGMRRLLVETKGPRLLAVAAMGLALVLLLAACGGASGSGIPSASGSQGAAPTNPNPTPTSASGGQGAVPANTNPTSGPVDDIDRALLYAQCIRANGYPEFPDPNADGQFMLRRDQGMSFNDPRYLAAQEACQDLRPAGLGGGDMENEERMETLRAFSQCMRDNGVPGFPDPAPGSGGRFVFTGQLPFDPYSPTFQRAVQACQSYIQGGMMTGGARR